MERTKYPRTYHFPFSPGMTSDDKVLKAYRGFCGQEVVVTEKMDGENTTIYMDYFHARSIDSQHRSYRDWVKRFQCEIGYKIPTGWRVCGENLFARHSISYDNLMSYFYGFSIWDENNVALCWDDTLMWFEELGITPVNELYRGIFSIDKMKEIADKLDTTKQEGFVCRVVGEIPYDSFNELVAKWVRPCHVTTEDHWMHQAIIPNQLWKSSQ